MMFPQVMLALTFVLGMAFAFEGTGTVYLQGGAAGSCGNINPDTALIAALDEAIMNPSLCGKQVRITNVGSDDGVGGAGNSVTVIVADTCPGCPSAQSIDLSVGAWDVLTGDAAYGTIEIEWDYV